MEGLHILIAVLDGNPVTKAYTFHLMINKPLCRFPVDKHTRVFLCICLRRKGRDLMFGIYDYHIALLHLLSEVLIQKGRCNVGIRSHARKFDVNPSPHK